MKNKFIRIIPFTLYFCAIIFNVITIIMLLISIPLLLKGRSFVGICFTLISAVCVVISVLVSREALKKGVKFFEDRVEFTWLDNDNVYLYSEITKVEAHKDTGASLSKGIVDRYSSLIIYLSDGTVATVELGITTKKVLQKVKNELEERVKS